MSKKYLREKGEFYWGRFPFYWMPIYYGKRYQIMWSQIKYRNGVTLSGIHVVDHLKEKHYRVPFTLSLFRR